MIRFVRLILIAQRGEREGRGRFACWNGDFSEKETFHGEKDQKKARNDEEEKAAPPQKIDGLGDEAFWTGNRVGGALYVLKKDIFIRISIGGPDNEETKINKSKALAQKALERL